MIQFSDFSRYTAECHFRWAFLSSLLYIHTEAMNSMNVLVGYGAFIQLKPIKSAAFVDFITESPTQIQTIDENRDYIT